MLFNHICRARIFEELYAHIELHDIIPFVSIWYGGVSVYYWRDQHGKIHKIGQGDGGEQGDALVPGLFCLVMWRTLKTIQNSLPAGALWSHIWTTYILFAIEMIPSRRSNLRNPIWKIFPTLMSIIVN